MTIRSLAMVMSIMAVLTFSPAFAQDHTHHAKADRQQEKTDKGCACCQNGKCPMMGDHKDCACCKNGKCSMMDKHKAGGCKDGKCPMMHHGASTSHPAPDGDEAAVELGEVMSNMHAAMAKPYTGDADADFVRGMIPHHQGAIDMANIVLKYGDDPQTRQLARQIIRAQKGEIALMRKWLRERQIPESGEFHFNR